MAKYERAAMIVIRVVVTWYRRRDTGTFHDKPVKTADATTIRAKTIQSAVWPESVARWNSGGVGIMVGMGFTPGADVAVANISATWS